MRIRLLTVTLLAVFAATSCKKDKDFKTAVVRDSGDVSFGGCGYLLDVDGEGEQKPVYLPSAYQHHGLKIKLKYHFSGILDTCGHTLPLNFHELIWIDDIKRDN